MSVPDLATAEGAERFAAVVLEGTADLFARRGEVRSRVHIIATRSWAGLKIKPGEVGAFEMLAATQRDHREKDAFAEMIRRTVSACRAIGVLHVAEAWISQGPEADADRLRSLPTIEHEPGVREAVFASFEHIRVSWQRVAWIVRPPDRPAYLEPFVNAFPGPPERFEGRFAKLLCRERFQ